MLFALSCGINCQAQTLKEYAKQHQKELEEMGWNVIIVWECQLKKDKCEQTLEQLYGQIVSAVSE